MVHEGRCFGFSVFLFFLPTLCFCFIPSFFFVFFLFFVHSPLLLCYSSPFLFCLLSLCFCSSSSLFSSFFFCSSYVIFLVLSSLFVSIFLLKMSLCFFVLFLSFFSLFPLPIFVRPLLYKRLGERVTPTLSNRAKWVGWLGGHWAIIPGLPQSLSPLLFHLWQVNRCGLCQFWVFGRERESGKIQGSKTSPSPASACIGEGGEQCHSKQHCFSLGFFWNNPKMGCVTPISTSKVTIQPDPLFYDPT